MTRSRSGPPPSSRSASSGAVTVGDAGWGAWIAGTTFSAFGCLLARRERDLVKRLRIAQEGLADRVRAEERNRIARELHDVIAHSLTVSLLHVSSARLALDEDPVRSRAGDAPKPSVSAANASPRCARSSACSAMTRPAAMAPLPGAAQLTTLVDQFRGAGCRRRVHDRRRPLRAAQHRRARPLSDPAGGADQRGPPRPGGAVPRALLAVTPTSAVLVVDSAGDRRVVGAGTGLLSMRERAADARRHLHRRARWTAAGRSGPSCPCDPGCAP